jgi:Short C-terminal domain
LRGNLALKHDPFVSVDWLARAERYIADGELSYALWALSGASRRFREAGDLDGMKRVLEVAEGLRPRLQDRRSAQHCDILTGGARDYIRFLTFRAEVAKLVELRDAGVITLDEFNKKKDELPDWRVHSRRPRESPE